MANAPLRVPIADIERGSKVLHVDTARYVLRVHRLGVGDTFVAFDPAGAVEADARITSASREDATIDLGEPRPARLLPKRAVTVLQGLAKGDKMDAIVRDATELGATAFVPVALARSVAQHKGEGAVVRWRRIALEAARQCGRGDVPTVEAPRSLPEALASSGGVGVVMVPGEAVAFGRVVAAHPSAPLALLIGPEGGLTDEEVEAATARGFVRASLGPMVLRTETACAAALGAILGIEGLGAGVRS